MFAFSSHEIVTLFISLVSGGLRLNQITRGPGWMNNDSVFHTPTLAEYGEGGASNFVKELTAIVLHKLPRHNKPI